MSVVYLLSVLHKKHACFHEVRFLWPRTASLPSSETGPYSRYSNLYSATNCVGCRWGSQVVAAFSFHAVFCSISSRISTDGVSYALPRL
jgi:hypothetical protein